MDTKQYFSIRRFFYFIKKDILMNYRIMIIYLVSLFLILFVSSIVVAYKYPYNWKFHYIAYPDLLLIFGFIITSMSFSDLKNPEKSNFFLTIPCSLFEKFVSRVIITSIGFVIFSLVFYYLFSIFTDSIINLIFSRNYSFFNPFDNNIISNIKFYIIFHSIFLLGAIIFRNHAFIKTMLAIFILIVIITVSSLMLFYIIYWSYQEGFPPEITIAGVRWHPIVAIFSDHILPVLKYVYWYIMPVLLWIISYVKFTNIQVKNGI